MVDDKIWERGIRYSNQTLGISDAVVTYILVKTCGADNDIHSSFLLFASSLAHNLDFIQINKYDGEKESIFFSRN